MSKKCLCMTKDEIIKNLISLNVKDCWTLSKVIDNALTLSSLFSSSSFFLNSSSCFSNSESCIFSLANSSEADWKFKVKKMQLTTATTKKGEKSKSHL